MGNSETAGVAPAITGCSQEWRTVILHSKPSPTRQAAHGR